MYSESKLVKSLVTSVALAVLTSGCASYEARQTRTEDPYNYLNSKQREVTAPRGSPYYNPMAIGIDDILPKQNTSKDLTPKEYK